MQQAFAQSRTVSGTVTDQATGQELPGVAVLVKGTSVGTATNTNGSYTINVPANGSTLVFRFIGYQTVEREIGNATTINISLGVDQKQLEEVVITGYGERKQESFTGSAVTLGGAKIEDKPFATVDQALQGNVPGLQLSASSGTPGAVQNIRIRGVSSITADNEPLYVIDGVPVVNENMNQSTATGSLSPLSSINSNDIENITVLKDASATALYGARGANGVIVITTKRGKAGKPVVTFSAQTGVVSRAVDGAEMLNAAQLDELYYEARVNAGQATSIEDARARYNSGWDGVTNTDWKDVVTNDDAITRTYNLSVRGGNEKSRYYVSAGHFKQDGVTVGSDYERTTGKINFESDFSDKVTFSTSTNGSYVLQNGQLEGSAYYGNPESSYLFIRPFFSAYNADGSLNLSNLGGSNFNPLYIAENDINRRKQARIFNSSSVEYRILNNLKFTSSLGLDYITNEELYYDNRIHGDGVNSTTDLSQNGASYVYSNRNFSYNWKNMLDYNWVINDNHKLDFKLVYEAQRNEYYNVGTGGYGIAANGLYYPASVGTVDYGSAYSTDWAINSAMALVTYTLRNNIFVDGTFRREGNSRFAPGQRWGTFYSIGGSWLLGNEAFMQGVSGWLTSSKLKASYGKTGNAGIDENTYQALLSYTGAYNSSPAISPSQLGNEYLSWENSYAFNVGLDFGLFNKINGSVEYFNRKSTDLLQEVPLSYTTGFAVQNQNVGEMINKGLEVSLDADVINSADFTWNLGVNFTTLKNEVTKLAKTAEGNEIAITSGVRRVAEGQPVYSWYMPTWAGVDVQTGAPLWYIEGTSGETTSTYSQAGYSYHGSALPTFFGGLNTRFDYKGIYLSANLYYSTGNNVYDNWAHYTLSDGRFNFGTSNGYATLYDRWQQPGDITDTPKNVYGNTSGSASASTRRLYDGEYLRLRDVTLGYNLPATLISKLGLSNVNLYVKGNNLWTWVKDDRLQFDPEVQSTGLLSITAAPLKTIAVGINASF